MDLDCGELDSSKKISPTILKSIVVELNRVIRSSKSARTDKTTVRTITDPNRITIFRRPDEGSKPLFQRKEFRNCSPEKIFTSLDKQELSWNYDSRLERVQRSRRRSTDNIRISGHSSSTPKSRFQRKRCDCANSRNQRPEPSDKEVQVIDNNIFLHGGREQEEDYNFIQRHGDESDLLDNESRRIIRRATRSPRKRDHFKDHSRRCDRSPSHCSSRSQSASSRSRSPERKIRKKRSGRSRPSRSRSRSPKRRKFTDEYYGVKTRHTSSEERSDQRRISEPSYEEVLASRSRRSYLPHPMIMAPYALPPYQPTWPMMPRIPVMPRMMLHPTSAPFFRSRYGRPRPF